MNIAEIICLVRTACSDTGSKRRQRLLEDSDRLILLLMDMNRKSSDQLYRSPPCCDIVDVMQHDARHGRYLCASNHLHPIHTVSYTILCRVGRRCGSMSWRP